MEGSVALRRAERMSRDAARKAAASLKRDQEREDRRNAMYAEMEAHPQSAEELLAKARVAKQRSDAEGDPLYLTRRKPKGVRRNAPGFEGRVVLGVRDIDDPIDPGQRVSAPVNIREGAVDHLFSRNKIDAALKHAGDWFRETYEAAALCKRLGIDPANPPSHGRLGDPITDRIVQAGRDLAYIIAFLGPIKSKIMISVVGEGRTVAHESKRWTSAGGIVSGDRAEGYVTGTLVDGLADIADEKGFVAVGRRKTVRAALRGPTKGELIVDGGRLTTYETTVLASGAIAVTGAPLIWEAGKFGDMVNVSKRPLDRTVLTSDTSDIPNNSARKRRKKRRFRLCADGGSG